MSLTPCASDAYVTWGANSGSGNKSFRVTITVELDGTSHATNQNIFSDWNGSFTSPFIIYVNGDDITVVCRGTGGGSTWAFSSTSGFLANAGTVTIEVYFDCTPCPGFDPVRHIKIDGVSETLSEDPGNVRITTLQDSRDIRLGADEEAREPMPAYYTSLLYETGTSAPPDTTRIDATLDTAIDVDSGTNLGFIVNDFLDGLEPYWKFDSGNVALDSNHGFDLTNVGSISTVAGKINEAASFDGSTQHFYVGDDAALHPSTKFTYFGWVKRADNALGDLVRKWSTGSNRTFLSRINAGAGNGGVIFYLDGAAGYGYTPAGVLSTGVWGQFVLVYDGGAGATNADRMRIFIDGVEQTLTFDASTVPASLPDGSADLEIGGPQFPLSGDLDETGFFPNRALTAYEAKWLNKGGAGRPFSEFRSAIPVVAPNLNYVNSPFAFVQGQAIRSIIPRNTGDTATACSADGSGDPFPSGLSIDADGTVHGNPSESGTFNILVANSNDGGSGPLAALTIVVRAAAQLGGISYGPNQRFRAASLALADDADVTTWDDDFGGNALTAIVGHKPKYKASVLGGIPAVYFNSATPSEMTLDVDWSNMLDGATIFAVFRNQKIGTDELTSYSSVISDPTDATSVQVGRTGRSGGAWYKWFGKEDSDLKLENDFMSTMVLGYSKRDGKFRMQLGYTAVNAAASGDFTASIDHLCIGGSTDAFGSPFKGYLVDLVIYTVPLSPADVAAVRAALDAEYNLDTAPSVLLDGDSITDNEARPSWPAYTFQQVSGSNTAGGKWGPIGNISVGGTGVAEAEARLPTAFTYIDPARDASVYLCSTGTNDLAANYRTLLQDARAGGFDKIVAATVIARTASFGGGQDAAGFETAKNTFNNIIRSWAGDGTYDAIADFAEDAIMGDPANCSDTTYFTDAIHPTAEGALRLSIIAAAAFDSLQLGPETTPVLSYSGAPFDKVCAAGSSTASVTASGSPVKAGGYSIVGPSWVTIDPDTGELTFDPTLADGCAPTRVTVSGETAGGLIGTTTFSVEAHYEDDGLTAVNAGGSDAFTIIMRVRSAPTGGAATPGGQAVIAKLLRRRRGIDTPRFIGPGVTR